MALLNKDLPLVIDYLERYNKKIGYILLITNGTIIPDKSLLNVLERNRINIRIIVDSYPIGNKNKVKEINELFLSKDLNSVIQNNFAWFDIGSYGANNEKDAKIRSEIFNTCPFRHCTALYDGNIYRCGRSWGMQLNNLEAECSDAVIDLNAIHSKHQMWCSLIKFFGMNYVNACGYCLKDCGDRRIPAGEQI